MIFLFINNLLIFSILPKLSKMTTADLTTLIKNMRKNIMEEKAKLELYKVTYDDMKADNIDTTDICKFIDNKQEQIKKLESELNACETTLNVINTMNTMNTIHSMKSNEDFSEIEEADTPTVATATATAAVEWADDDIDEEMDFSAPIGTNNNKPSYAIVVADPNTAPVAAPIAAPVAAPVAVPVANPIRTVTDYNGEVITTFKSKIEGYNMGPFLKEMATVRNKLDKLEFYNGNDNDSDYALIGTIYPDIYIVAENKGNGEFNTDIKIGWTTSVPRYIFEDVKDALNVALYDSNENNITEDLNSDITIVYADKNVKNPNHDEDYKVYLYKW